RVQSYRAEARTRRNLAVVREIKAGCADPTRRAISAAFLAACLKKSARTARRLWAEPRNLYEARSRARQKPWQAEGVFRATWSRRKGWLRTISADRGTHARNAAEP